MRSVERLPCEWSVAPAFTNADNCRSSACKTLTQSRRAWSGSLAALAVLAIASATPATADAQSATPAENHAANPDDEIAKGLFAAGKAAFDAGQYQEAYDRFFDAYAKSPRPALLYNLAVSLDRLRRDDEALRHYRGYLAEVPDAENRAEVENRIRAIDAAIEERKKTVAPAPAPTPAPTTQRSTQVDLRLGTTRPKDDGGSVLEEWWFWTAAAVVVGATVTGIVVATSGDDVRGPMSGSDGMVVLTLTKAP